MIFGIVFLFKYIPRVCILFIPWNVECRFFYPIMSFIEWLLTVVYHYFFSFTCLKMSLIPFAYARCVNTKISSEQKCCHSDGGNDKDIIDNIHMAENRDI